MAIMKGELASCIRKARRRVRYVWTLRWLSRFLAASFGVSLIWVLAGRLGLAPEAAVGQLLLVFASGVTAALAIAFGTPLHAFHIARTIDNRGRTGDRLASAVEFAFLQRHDPMTQLQTQDAEACAAALDIAKLYPITVPREAIAALALAAFLFGGVFLPNLPVFWTAAQKQDAAEVRKEGARIDRVSRDAQKAAERNHLDETRRAAFEAQKLAEAMKRGNITRKQSLIALQKLTDRLSARQDALARAAASGTPALRKAVEELRRSFDRQQQMQSPASLAKAGPAEATAQQLMRQFLQALANGDAEAQNKALQNLAELVQSGALGPGAMARLQRELAQMGQALSRTEMQQVARQLAEIAKLMERMKLDPRTLQRLAEMMRRAGGT